MRLPFSPRVAPLASPQPEPDPISGVTEEAPEFGEEQQGEEEYKAFSAVANVQSVEALWLRRTGVQAHIMLDYAWRRMIHFDGLGFALSLVYTDCTVRILGRNLGVLMEKLQNRKVQWVQLYDAARWPKPAPEKPIVTAIVVQFPSERERDQKSNLKLIKKKQGKESSGNEWRETAPPEADGGHPLPSPFQGEADIWER